MPLSIDGFIYLAGPQYQSRTHKQGERDEKRTVRMSA
jgi:hypothetical protein